MSWHLSCAWRAKPVCIVASAHYVDIYVCKVTTMQTCVFIKSSNLSNQSEEYVFNISVLWAILWNSSAKDIYDYIKLTNVLVQNSVFY